jgi:heme/copper-type cytochrome/quinol oxidase subunit 2
MTNTVIALAAFVIYGVLIALFALAWKHRSGKRQQPETVEGYPLTYKAVPQMKAISHRDLETRS